MQLHVQRPEIKKGVEIVRVNVMVEGHLGGVSHSPTDRKLRWKKSCHQLVQMPVDKISYCEHFSNPLERGGKRVQP